MKKHLLAIVIIVLVLSLGGVGIWLYVRNRNIKPLYQASCEFIHDEDTALLKNKILQAEDKMTEAEQLHSLPSSGNRLSTLNQIIDKIDIFEQDLNTYLVFNNAKPKTTKNLSKSYTNLSKSRTILLREYDEYITRMSGNLNADGHAIENLYNEIFNKTVNYRYKYNACFNQTSSYVFENVYKVDTIKSELYLLYSLGVNNLLNNISNNNFKNTTLITKLNNGIILSNGNIDIKDSVKGGEFSIMAFKFKSHFNKSNLSTLVENFDTLYNININPDNEISNEKLAIYYAKQILEI
jgi:hypothetical protein